MLTIDAERVIAIVCLCDCHAVYETQVRHREFPELHAEGESAAAAGTQLKHLLRRSLDSVPFGDRRQAIESAIHDVEEFISKSV